MNRFSLMDNFTEGIKDGIPICLGYISVSFAFGIYSLNQGLSIWQTVAVSMANVTSAGQLAGVPIITGLLPLSEMALTQLIINARYALMSISLSQKLDNKVTLFDRLIIAFVNTDEVFAVASGKAETVGKHYLFGLILTPYLGWTFGTILGATAGNILPQTVVNALGIAIYGMFLAIIIPVAKKQKPVLLVIITSVVLSCLIKYIPIFNSISAGFSIIICAIISSTILSITNPIQEKEGSTND